MTRVSGKQDGDQLLKRLGKAIRAERRTAGLSQEALADAAEIDRSHMGKIERGERNVTLLNLMKIAAALRMKSSAILAAAGL
jgi:transcriptional regulator with XRE-family HTH domain